MSAIFRYIDGFIDYLFGTSCKYNVIDLNQEGIEITDYNYHIIPQIIEEDSSVVVEFERKKGDAILLGIYDDKKKSHVVAILELNDCNTFKVEYSNDGETVKINGNEILKIEGKADEYFLPLFALHKKDNEQSEIKILKIWESNHKDNESICCFPRGEGETRMEEDENKDETLHISQINKIDQSKRKASEDLQLRATKKICIDVRNIEVYEVNSGLSIFSGRLNKGEVYHFKFRINKFDDRIDFGYCAYHDKVKENDPYIKILSDKSEIFNGTEITSIKGNVGVYEVIYDMINYKMSIKQGNDPVVEVCQINSDIIYPFVEVSNSSDNEIRLIEYWKLPVVIERYRLTNTSNESYTNPVNNKTGYICTLYNKKAELYENGSDYISDKIKYVVCNKVFKDEGDDKYNYTINIEMKENDGIYHFYYEIMSVDTAGIRFGYCQNRDLANEVTILHDIPVENGKVYEVIYDMIHMQMCIIKDGYTVLSPQVIPTSTDSSSPIYPRISTGDRGGSVKLIEYYKERENYGFNDITMYINTRIDEIKDYKGYNKFYRAEELGLPNSIYGLYNYEKYYWLYELSLIKTNAPNTDITPIKKIIESRFRLNEHQMKYIDKSDITDLIIFLKYYAEEMSEYLDLPDSFVKIVNSLSIKSSDDVKYLEFRQSNVNVFQFPMNRIYIRDCYYEMFRDICKCLSVDKSNIVVTGQPGIGKTSFIYVLLYFIRNNYLYYPFDNNLKTYLECEELKKEIESISNNGSTRKIDELLIKNGIKFTKEDNANYNDLIEKGLNHHIDDKVINSDDNVWIKNDEKFKDIYIIKGKKYGDEDKRKVYLMRDGVIFKIDSMQIILNEIRDSIIIVDTLNEIFNDSNKIISISSPDHNNNSNYEDSRKELYFESLSEKEINEWFVNCIGFDIHSVSDDDDSNDFKRICKKYGNIPRQIYYHYLYRKNYENRDYWDYYKQLIESVVGTTGYSKFIEKYMEKENLPKNDLSNIILKYDLQLTWDNDLEKDILLPKEKLKFISEDVEKYIVCKFYPPRNLDEYTQIDNYYKSIKDNDDELVKRMALKQKIAYKLSKKEIQLYDNTKNSYNFRAKTVTATAKVDTLNDPNFEIDSKKEVYVYNPIDGCYFVYYILNEENYFDLIMNGVFIKILLDGEEDKDNNEKIAESIREYSEKKEGYFIYCVIQNEAVKRCNSHFKVDALSVPAKGASIPPLPSNQQQSFLPKVKDFDIYVGARMYLMRKCFKDMWDIISNDNFAFDYQRNYLILGHSRIGKSVLAEVIRDKILKNSINVYYKGKYCNIRLSKRPYVVISDGEVIGEDDYADAKMIIVIDNAYDDKCKTFQSKRCPLVMYIPPFTEEEVNEVVLLKSLKHKLQLNTFTNYNSIKDKVIFNEKKYAEEIKKYTENCTYNGGIIGNNLITDIDDEIQKVIREHLIEITKGRSKSSLSKTVYQNVFIYETDENDVTKSGKLRFISEKVRDKVYDNLFSIDTMGKCIEMLNVLLDNSDESFAGHLYERIILFLMKNSEQFQHDLVTKMRTLNNLVELSDYKDNPTVFVAKKIQSHEGLKTEIENLKEENNKITFYDLSYDKSFPDIDALVGPCGIQITIKDKHKFAPQMVMILQNLYKIYRNGYNDVKNSFQEINLALRYGYFLISPIENPTIKVVEKREMNKYPDIFRKLTIEDKELDKDKKVRRDLEEKAKEVAKSIRITFTDLKTYVK